MSKTRLEAFSDGVFAIVITLLILDIRLPEVEAAQLPEALRDALPKLGAYGMSFIIIGLYWVSHHRAFDTIKRVDGAFLWFNILFLLVVSFIPFPTSLLGRYPSEQVPIVLYGCTLMCANLVAFVMLSYVSANQHLAVDTEFHVYARAQRPLYLGVNGCYLAGVLLASRFPTLSYLLFALPVASVVCITVARTRPPKASASETGTSGTA